MTCLSRLRERALAATLAAAIAAPALAQAAPPAPPVPPAGSPSVEQRREVRVYRMDRREGMFGNVSVEGRALLSEALRTNRPEDRAQVQAARDRINTLIAAERLDMAALRKAMADERRIVDEQHARRQAALLEAVGKLTPADRKAFAEDAMKGRRQAEARADEWRRWAEEYRRRMKDMPPPPLPPVPPAPPSLPGID
jgi:Spy/CpxP family protein refolding chaperone